MSINAIGTNKPIEVSKGGTGVATLGAFGTLYGNGTSPVAATATGTAGDVLTSNGAGVAPTYQPVSALPGAGAFELIQTQTAANSASLEFTAGLSTYSTLFFTVNNILAVTPATTFFLDFSSNGGATWTVAVNGSNAYLTGIASTMTNTGTRQLSSPKMPSSGSGYNGNFYIYQNNVAGFATYQGDWFIQENSDVIRNFGLTWQQSTISTTVNAYRFRMSSGNILSGTIIFYGLRTS